MKPGQLAALLLVGLAGAASGQEFPLSMVVTQGQTSQSVANNGTISFATLVGQTASARVLAIYTGRGEITISQRPQVFGPGFTLGVHSAVPFRSRAGGAFDFEIIFTPTTTQGAGRVTLPITETLPGVGGEPPVVNSLVLTLALQNLAPSFQLSYALQPDGNTIPLPPGGEVPFAPTLVGGNGQAALTVTNAGVGPGIVSGISYSGHSAFRLQRTPLLPATIPPAQNIQFLILYNPTDETRVSGQITISFPGAPSLLINVSGSGIAPRFSYQVLDTTPPTPVNPGGTFRLADTEVGQTSTVTIQVTNRGTANGTINSVTITGAGFALASALTLPRVLEPNATLVFLVAFTPARPGSLTGTLTVNSDVFTLNGLGLGPLLTFSYVAAGTTVTLGPTNNTVVFAPVMVSRSAELVLTVRNTGSLPAPLSSIGVNPVAGPFTLTGVPPLPLSLAPNGSFELTIAFTPVALGISTSVLVVDTANITLTGSATAPPPLPAYTIEGPSGSVAPLSQPTVRLRLSTPYPVAITGSLALSVASGNLPADPAVQFATGGQTVAFRIPANQTEAVFGSQGTQVGMQTGTVAGSIALTPSFATQAGNINLTPATPATLQFSVNPAPPSLIAVQVVNPVADGFSIQVTGFTTTRALSEWTIELTPAPGFSLPVTRFTIDVSQVARAWFQSVGSQVFGGQFRMTVPFTFQGIPAGQTAIQGISAVSATVSNASGQSAASQVRLR
jgi:hypothetical protein